MSSADRVQCLLCPFGCILKPGERGTCRVRLNLDGELVSLVYGLPVAVHVDPVEKKPLFHFRPGSPTFSIACVGCNLGCLYCQNWEISQARPEEVPPVEMQPGEVVASAIEAGCTSISYTYTEPIVWYEYMLDTAKAAREAGLANILITAGYINEGPLRELAPYIDAANVDLKGITDSFYARMCSGTLAPVLRTLEVLSELGVWLEVTNLVIPDWNDSEDDISSLCSRFFELLGGDVPLHFSRFFPMYRLVDLPPTPVSTLERARLAAGEAGLRYVYVGNATTSGGETTTCPDCGEELVVRHGFSVETMRIESGACPCCSARIPGVWN
jgi:pyruvate formate lyase activating enzyme